MISKIPESTDDYSLQMNKQQKSGQEENEAFMAKQYPLVVRPLAGPLMVFIGFPVLSPIHFTRSVGAGFFK